MWDFRFEMWNIQKFGIVLRGKLPDIFLMSEIRSEIFDLRCGGKLFTKIPCLEPTPE